MATEPDKATAFEGAEKGKATASTQPPVSQHAEDVDDPDFDDLDGL